MYDLLSAEIFVVPTAIARDDNDDEIAYFTVRWKTRKLV